MQCDGETLANGAAGRHECNVVIIESSGVTVDGEAPVLYLPAVAESAQRGPVVADVGKATSELDLSLPR